MFGGNKRLEALLERLAHNEVQAIKRHQQTMDRLARQDQERERDHAVLIERTEATHRALIRILASLENRDGDGDGRKPKPFSPILPDDGDDGGDGENR